jgi:Transposase IS116/IS110/IS902 family/Transposase
MFCGIDWASERHAVCVLDDAGTTISTFEVAHSADGLEQLVTRLGRLGDPATLPVAIERPEGRLVDRLLEAGHLVEQRVAATNQLSACLDAFWPGAKQVFADLERPIALDFLARYPTPESAARLGEAPMQGFLTKHGSSGRRHPTQLLARLHAAPPGLVDTPQVKARRDAVLALVGVLRALNHAIKQLDRSVAAHLGEHPDAEIFTSLPRSGQSSAAQVLAEWGDCRPAYDHPDAVACLAGIVPVTKASGKHTAVSFRWACNKRFRAAITGWADNSRHQSPWAAKGYADAVARGRHHPHAVRVLARAWVRVIRRSWQDGVPYDPAKHNAARTLTEMAASAGRG